MPKIAHSNATSNVVGLLRLDEPITEHPKARDLDHPHTLAWRTIPLNVPGASLDAILRADPAIAHPFVNAAKDLERQGAKLIISNCGYTIAYDKMIRENVNVAVASSSLLLLPLIAGLITDKGRIGILTFDASKLTQRHLELAWPEYNQEKVLLSGLEGTRAWQEITQTGLYDADRILDDSLSCLEKLTDDASVEAVLIECCALCAFIPAYRARTELPVFDMVTMAEMLIASLGGTREPINI